MKGIIIKLVLIVAMLYVLAQPDLFEGEKRPVSDKNHLIQSENLPPHNLVELGQDSFKIEKVILNRENLYAIENRSTSNPFVIELNEMNHNSYK